MTDWLANLLVGCIVAVAVCYAAYSLGPAKFRTRVLTLIGRIFGMRVLGFLLRHSRSGCGDCGQAGSHRIKKNFKPVR